MGTGQSLVTGKGNTTDLSYQLMHIAPGLLEGILNLSALPVFKSPVPTVFLRIERHVAPFYFEYQQAMIRINDDEICFTLP